MIHYWLRCAYALATTYRSFCINFLFNNMKNELCIKRFFQIYWYFETLCKFVEAIWQCKLLKICYTCKDAFKWFTAWLKLKNAQQEIHQNYLLREYYVQSSEQKVVKICISIKFPCVKYTLCSKIIKWNIVLLWKVCKGYVMSYIYTFRVSILNKLNNLSKKEERL